MNPISVKPWKERYSVNQCSLFDLKQTLYTTYVEASANRLDEIAVYVNDTGKRYSNRELLALADKASAGFSALGINENSKVGIFLNGTIEEAVTLLALNKIGVVCKYVDYMKSIPAMKHSIEETDLALLVMDESFLPLEKLINEKHLPVVVAYSEHTYTDNAYIPYEKLYSSDSIQNSFIAPYVDGKPTIMINSSGTTGESKPIVHTDYSVNAAAQKMLYTDYPLGCGNLLTKMVPSQIGLGLITSLYTGLISGTGVVLFRGESAQELVEKTVSFTKNFEQFKNVQGLGKEVYLNIFTAPAFIRAIIHCKDITNLSFVGSMLAAGSKMSKEELDDLEQIAAQKGCAVPICNGYGQNEMAGAVTLNLIHHNINGSAGFPTFGTDVIVVDPKSKEPLGPNKVGLILESSNSEFLEYENLIDKTKDAYILLSDGSCWFNSCDLGYMDEAGYLYITGRTTRVVIKSDFKISLDEIERKIRALSFVSDCATIVSEYGGSDEQITALIESENTIEKDIQDMIRSANILSEYEMPSQFLIIEKIPYKTNGKIDYEKLKRMYGQQ